MDAATVPAEFAHKADHRNLWLTGVDGRDSRSVAFGFRIPDAVQPGIAEYVEVQRQATHAFAHLQLGVPLGSRALLSTAELLLDEGWRVLPRSGRVAVRANIDDRAARGVADIDVGLRFIAPVGPGSRDERIGEGRITGKYLPQRLYDRIRGSSARRSAAAVDAVTEPPVGQVVEELAVDVGNPILGDHESDHISGMVVVCAAERLAGQHFPERRLRGLVTRFFAFIEKSDPAHVVLQVIDDRVVATVMQRGIPCAQADGTLEDGERGEEAA